MDSLFNFDADTPNEPEKGQERADVKTRFQPGHAGGPGRPAIALTKKDYRVIEGLVISGHTNEEIAKIMGFNADTFYVLMHRDAHFSEILLNSKEKADAAVLNSMYRRAMGYRYKENKKKKIKSATGQTIETTEESHSKYLPPDTRAAHIWLMNRNPDKWKERPEANTQINNNTNVVQHKVDWAEATGCDPLEPLPNETAEEPDNKS